jgi:hypothetical protein
VIILGEKKGKIEFFCSNCGATARYTCINCEKPLCGRCRSRKKKSVLSNVIIPSGLCKKCSENRLQDFEEGQINTLSESVLEYADPIISAPKSSDF